MYCILLYIFGNVDIELDALESNFEITKEHLRFPSVFGLSFLEKQNYQAELNGIAYNIIYDELDDFEEYIALEENIEACYQRLVAVIRGCLYTFDDVEYENAVSQLKGDLEDCQNLLTATALNSAINLSKQDRVSYPKLVFS